MTYEKIFSEVQKNFKKAKISDFTRDFAFQFNITGEGEGIFYAAYKNGVLSVEPYDYQDRDVIFTADGKTFTDVASGKLEPIDAIKNGKLTVDGNRDAAKEIMLLIKHEKKAEAKPAAKKAAPKPTKAAAKTAEPKSEAKTAEKKAVKTEVKPAAKVGPKSEAKSAAKSEAKTPAKAKASGRKAKK
ncbi:MAG: SCP2 sterol-binding domain-containing protein [Bacteroides sp.]|nr:SCP2 sterol-binding domain-containing protein [Bacteroides sp.]